MSVFANFLLYTISLCSPLFLMSVTKFMKFVDEEGSPSLTISNLSRLQELGILSKNEVYRLVLQSLPTDVDDLYSKFKR